MIADNSKYFTFSFWKVGYGTLSPKSVGTGEGTGTPRTPYE